MSRARWFAFTALAFLLSLLSPVIGQPVADAPAFLTVVVPTADAKLEVDGLLTKKVGLAREFITPALMAGKKYTYTFKLTYLDKDKKEVVKEKQVVVEAGKQMAFDFEDPKKEEPKKEEPKKKEEMKKEEPKKETPKKEEPKKEEPKKEEPKKEEPKKETPKKEEPKKEEPKKETPKKEEPKKEEPKKEEPKKEIKKEEPKKEEPKKIEKTIIVPYVPTPQKVVDEMLKLASVKEGDVVYDLGCGDGRIVVTAVKQFKAKKGIGIDLDAARVKDSLANAKKADVEKLCEFRQGDVLKIKDLSEASVITLYLLPAVNVQLAPILKSTLKPGSRIVSHDFDMGKDWKAEKEITVMDEDGISHSIFLWVIPPAKK